MNKKQLRISIIGAGAIGGVTAGLLAKNGHNIEIVCKHREIVDKIKTDGLRVSGVAGEFNAKMDAVKDIADLSGKKDIVLVATKVNDTAAAVSRVIPFLENDSLVISLQNGIIEDEIAQIAGGNRVIGCVVAWSATMHSPGDVEYTRAADFIVGDMYGLGRKKVELAAGLLEDAVPTRISDNIRGELYSKLVINCCINSLSAITGQPLGPLLAEKKARNLFIIIMKEAINVANAEKIKVEPALGGMLDFYEFLSGDNEDARKKRDEMIMLMGKRSHGIKPSSLQSLERGNPTEIPWLNGYIVDKARKIGVSVPAQQAMVNIIDQIEKHELVMTPDNLNHPELTFIDT